LKFFDCRVVVVDLFDRIVQFLRHVVVGLWCNQVV